MEKSCQNNEKNYTDLDIYSKHQCCQTFFSGDSDTKYTGQLNCYFIFSLPKKEIEKKFDNNEKNYTDFEIYSKHQCCHTFFFGESVTKYTGQLNCYFIFSLPKKEIEKSLTIMRKMAYIWKLIPSVNVISLFW